MHTVKEGQAKTRMDEGVRGGRKRGDGWIDLNRARQHKADVASVYVCMY